MRYRLYAVTSLLILFIFIFSGCTTITQEVLSVPMAYDSAVRNLAGMDFTATIFTMKQTVSEGVTYTENNTITVTYLNYAAEDMQVLVQKSILIDEYTVDVTEYYEDNSVYLSVNGGCFTVASNPEEALLRYTPFGVLDAGLYEDIQVQKTDEQTQIGFTQPKQPERWAIPQGAEMTDAAGHAILLEDGTLSVSTYSLSYQYGSAMVTYSASADFDFDAPGFIGPPEPVESYIPVADIDAPVMLEMACARLQQADNITAKSEYNINCDAGGLHRTQAVETKILDTGSTFEAQVETEITLKNISQPGNTTTATQTEIFADGKYQVTSSNSQNPPPAVTEEDMRSYCRSNLVSSALLPQYIETTEITTSEDSYYLSFGASGAFARLLFSNAYQTLYSDAVVTDTLIRSYRTQEISGYIEINMYSGLPVCSGFSYIGENTIDQTTLTFAVSMTQEYYYGG